ncbi:MAG: type 2 isopentenyl-diphosphate Delta-isomerase [Candidatus Parvarchaeota archaeon]|nr:type 2 isopentenyl-diphosphate Delta-isomerase [Candidatus Jingweiarchaeum tengchongense]MCW1298216.1 type 2 isopentenyl-diphosphate Delta-isomerase [Candidatus Jingweiarchaeum tengchongense]MCW1300014.1 type 2 isopentenyl-diphosphate Delta-isomerase [Candidatus Jingweiarchaeum tengchongense]MCW1304847.1 type 2 isopentenyl-diphosphate Delta-isomerase [Candidatus Jingweiarchaeum tengchongense]MCW1305437.1 type 2 isopentenyl-diphosphate Delta-isomerase [Candidatus Jingweiarchaeum tengchongense
MLDKEIERRKKEQLEICAREDVAYTKKTGFEDVIFFNNSTPEINFDEIDTSCKIFNKKLSAPIIISAMTGGFNYAKKINEILAEAADKKNIGMGVGSQRIMIKYPEVTDTFSIVREKAPRALIISNIGASQVASEYNIKNFSKIIDAIKADALAVHLNFPQEVVCNEGKIVSKGLLQNLSKLTKEIGVPVIAKECGAGISKESALKLDRAGVSGFDIGGSGGTNFIKVEAIRAKKRKDFLSVKTADVFSEWGIETVVSLCEVKSVIKDKIVICSGGIRNGLEIAKAISLGADAAGLALPFLKAAYGGNVNNVINLIDDLIYQLKVAMFLTGSKNLRELRNKAIITGRTREILKVRGVIK